MTSAGTSEALCYLPIVARTGGLPDAHLMGHNMAQSTCSKEHSMHTVVRARIDQATKDEASAILDAVGLTVSDAFRMMMRRIVAERRLPFDPLVPNAATIAAIKAARRGELESADSVEDLFVQLERDDATG